MIDTLPKKIWANETGIVNLDSIHGSGTHWVCYRKQKNVINYFDSFGNLRPPYQLVSYFKTSDQQPVEIYYNYNRHQRLNTVNCGHLCLLFLSSDVLLERNRFNTEL